MARMSTPKIAQRVKVSILPSSDAKESVELDYRFLNPGNFSKSEPGSLGVVKNRRLRTIGKKGDFQKSAEGYQSEIEFESLPINSRMIRKHRWKSNLDFQDIKDFHPDEIVKKVEPLQKLLEARERLKELKLTVLKDAKFKESAGRCSKRRKRKH